MTQLVTSTTALESDFNMMRQYLAKIGKLVITVPEAVPAAAQWASGKHGFTASSEISVKWFAGPAFHARVLCGGRRHRRCRDTFDHAREWRRHGTHDLTYRSIFGPVPMSARLLPPRRARGLLAAGCRIGPAGAELFRRVAGIWSGDGRRHSRQGNSQFPRSHAGCHHAQGHAEASRDVTAFFGNSRGCLPVKARSSLSKRTPRASTWCDRPTNSRARRCGSKRAKSATKRRWRTSSPFEHLTPWRKRSPRSAPTWKTLIGFWCSKRRSFLVDPLRRGPEAARGAHENPVPFRWRSRLARFRPRVLPGCRALRRLDPRGREVLDGRLPVFPGGQRDG